MVPEKDCGLVSADSQKTLEAQNPRYWQELAVLMNFSIFFASNFKIFLWVFILYVIHSSLHVIHMQRTFIKTK